LFAGIKRRTVVVIGEKPKRRNKEQKEITVLRKPLRKTSPAALDSSLLSRHPNLKASL